MVSQCPSFVGMTDIHSSCYKTAYKESFMKIRPALLLALATLSASPLVHAASADQAQLLTTHNLYRAELELPPLIWSADLEKSALAWAEDLASRNAFQHSQSANGENLWKGTAGAYSQADMVHSWGSEKQYYVHGTFPKVTTGGVVGHYTQMIWRQTTQVGCGLASGKGFDVLVCQYNPPGNWMGQSPY